MKPWIIGLLTLIFVFVVMISAHGYLMNNFCSFEQRGQFGDMFGVVNALFSGLAFAGVVYTLYSQGSDIEEQKFQTVFFQLLQLNNDIVNSMDFHGKFGERKGRDVFRTYYLQLNRMCQPKTEMKDLYADSLTKKMKPPYDISIEQTLRKYEIVFARRQSDLGHYFRNLYHTYRFLDESKIKDKEKYGRIIRSQLSSYELVMLFYNCLSEHGKDQFYPLVVKYKIIKNMDWKLVFNSSHIDEYPKTAYE